MGGIDHNETACLQKELDEVNTAAEKYLKNPSGNDQNPRFDLHVKINRLLQTVRGPTELLFANFESVAHISAIRTLLEARVFDAIPSGGESMTAEEISAKTGLEKEILVRLMRTVTPFGPFRETGEEQYAHTAFSEIYLCPNLAAMFSMMLDDFGLPMLRSHEFFCQDEWKNKITLRHNPYTFTHGCEGTTMFQHISSIPHKFTRFNKAMVAQDDGGLAVDMYPFANELGKDAEDGRATVIDVGGGCGHILRQIKGLAPNLKGRFILQDQPTVIEENGKAMENDGFEAMAHDFFTPQPIRGALGYYIRRCLHDWPDSEAKKILENLAKSMDREKSRVLITEFVVPESGAGMLPAWMDQTMLTFGGVERTEKGFADLLDISGLKLVKVWRASGTPTGVVEARLKAA